MSKKTDFLAYLKAHADAADLPALEKLQGYAAISATGWAFYLPGGVEVDISARTTNPYNDRDLAVVWARKRQTPTLLERPLICEVYRVTGNEFKALRSPQWDGDVPHYEWMLECTPENMARILAEAIRMNGYA